MEKAFELQKKARDNAKTVQSYMTDLLNWETEMKRKEAALNGQAEQDLPPVRSKVKKEKPVQVKKKLQKRISASDYSAWEKFDVDKACEDIDMAEVGPSSLDSKLSTEAKMEKLKEEAQYEKERGNTFVKKESWDEAIKCYNRAIELVKDDAIYYANRGLCYLKKESLHQAESDCTEALRLDPTYVKALQRRATAREKLGSLRAASQDLVEVIKLEPNNVAARKQLDAIKSKSKSSPLSTPTAEAKPVVTASKSPPKVLEISKETSRVVQEPIERWKEGIGEEITVMKPVKKPPHLRSKRPLKSVHINEIQLGKTLPEKTGRMKIIEVENNDTNKIDDKVISEKHVSSPESVKLITDALVTEKDAQDMVAPVNSVQFMSEWKYLKCIKGARSNYLSIIEPSKLPTIFANALESEVLSDLITELHDYPQKFGSKTISAYLKYLCNVKRFSTLAMFLSSKDKEHLMKLLEHCKTVEKCSDAEIADLKNKYEI